MLHEVAELGASSGAVPSATIPEEVLAIAPGAARGAAASGWPVVRRAQRLSYAASSFLLQVMSLHLAVN